MQLLERSISMQREAIGLGVASKLLAGVGALACSTAVAVEPPTLVIYVDQAAPATGQDGSSWQHAFRDLQDAIQSARSKIGYFSKSNLEFRLAQGVFKPDRSTFDRNARFDFSFDVASAISLSILGSFAGLSGPDADTQDFVATRTILSGDLRGDDQPGFVHREDNSLNVARVELNPYSITLAGVTIRSGNCTPNNVYRTGASGLQVSGRYSGPVPPGFYRGRTAIHNCIFEENQSDVGQGAGLYVDSSVVSIYQSAFTNNRSIRGMGGGAFISSDVYDYTGVSASLFQGNSAVAGGALFLENPRTIWRCTFVDNHAALQGGAVFGEGDISASLFLRNAADVSGGALAASGVDTLSVRLCTLAANQSPIAPAISVYSSRMVMDGVIVWGNESLDPNAPHIRAMDSLFPAKVSNSVIERGINGMEITGVQPVAPSAILSADPEFIRPAFADDPAADWQAWSYRVHPNSPAVGLGRTEAWTHDLDDHYLLSSNLVVPVDAGCYFSATRDCPADLNRAYPRVVDDSDFAIFLTAYNIMISPPANPDADLNRDGLVDDADFLIFVAAYDRLLCS